MVFVVSRTVRDIIAAIRTRVAQNAYESGQTKLLVARVYQPFSHTLVRLQALGSPIWTDLSYKSNFLRPN